VNLFKTKQDVVVTLSKSIDLVGHGVAINKMIKKLQQSSNSKWSWFGNLNPQIGHRG